MPKNRINGRKKGSEGEREFARWLKEKLDLDFLPTRNLDQVRDGGADIMTVPPFIFEVKRVEKISRRDWWLQVVTASRKFPETVPVVAYRQNRQPWRFLISANCIGLDKGFVQIEEFEAISWFKKLLYQNIQTGMV
jgi:hypothetical protein